MPLTFSTKADAKALLRFQLYSVYHNLQGLSAIFVSLLCCVFLIVRWESLSTGYKLLLIFLGVFYLLFKPVQLYLKSKLLAKQDAFNLPVEFTCDEDKITVKQGTESAEFTWDMIWKIVVRKKDVYVYTGKIYAYMIQKDQTGENWKSFVTMAEQKGCSIK